MMSKRKIQQKKAEHGIKRILQETLDSIKMISIQKIEFPSDCIVTNNNFYNYEPATSFNEAHSLKYLNEDLLQCSFPKDNMIIDLGWYGDLVSNKGEFRIYIIQNQNWEFPFNIIYSKSVEEIKSILAKIFLYYTRTDFNPESSDV